MLADHALQHRHQLQPQNHRDDPQSPALSNDAKPPPDQKPREEQHRHQNQEQDDYFLHEFLSHIPTFQYGMDVNPSFTLGISGYEWTAQLSSFDLLRVKLVHGWLIDPVAQSEIYRAAGSDCYNVLVERIVQSHEAWAEIDSIHRQIQVNSASAQTEGNEASPRLDELWNKARELSALVARGTLVEDFMSGSSHQLTDYGLRVLHEEIRDGELVVFFRNNHFGTLTKREGNKRK
jgi:hypothetical protein